MHIKYFYPPSRSDEVVPSPDSSDTKWAQNLKNSWISLNARGNTTEAQALHVLTSQVV
jgi:hypothetical protein